MACRLQNTTAYAMAIASYAPGTQLFPSILFLQALFPPLHPYPHTRTCTTASGLKMPGLAQHHSAWRDVLVPKGILMYC